MLRTDEDRGPCALQRILSKWTRSWVPAFAGMTAKADCDATAVPYAVAALRSFCPFALAPLLPAFFAGFFGASAGGTGGAAIRRA